MPAHLLIASSCCAITHTHRSCKQASSMAIPPALLNAHHSISLCASSKARAQPDPLLTPVIITIEPSPAWLAIRGGHTHRELLLALVAQLHTHSPSIASMHSTIFPLARLLLTRAPNFLSISPYSSGS
ncbi:hypothetical protein GOP47_0026112 [Adiantum capillus-veneris]|uniref:Uncharacterized protein n=1 Tax=Adiantum capillus-veneris TaxID=13818 RepID=A0A9D4U2H0_ADICA|nr:hypothetical protein GOP47_0026112 [Adiantum capillus-veneris]